MGEQQRWPWCASQQIFIVVGHFLYEYSTRQQKPHREAVALRWWLGFQMHRATDSVQFARFALMSTTEQATDHPSLRSANSRCVRRPRPPRSQRVLGSACTRLPGGPSIALRAPHPFPP